MNQASNNGTAAGHSLASSNKYPSLPKFNTGAARIVSLQSYDHSINDSFQHTLTRTVSGSSTVMSTPLNRRRTRHQAHRAAAAAAQHQSQPRKPDLSHAMLKRGRLIKSKLLNLTQSLKETVAPMRLDPLKLFVIHKPSIIGGYDYLVFANSLVRESQVNGWELAERAAKNIIFTGDSSDDDTADADAANDSISGGALAKVPAASPYTVSPFATLASPLAPTPPATSSNNIIELVPGYTRDELVVVLGEHGDANHRLYEHKKRVHNQHEELFASATSFAHKRQVQIAQKKEVLERVFGSSNQLNSEYITNNTSYLALDNALNLQKTFLEDRDEVALIIAEEKAFAAELAASERVLSQPPVALPAKQRRRSPPIADVDIDHDKLQLVVHERLTAVYASIVEEEDPDIVDHMAEELQGYVCRHLRKRIRDD